MLVNVCSLTGVNYELLLRRCNNACVCREYWPNERGEMSLRFITDISSGFDCWGWPAIVSAIKGTYEGALGHQVGMKRIEQILRKPEVDMRFIRHDILGVPMTCVSSAQALGRMLADETQKGIFRRSQYLNRGR